MSNMSSIRSCVIKLKNGITREKALYIELGIDLELRVKV